MSSGNRSIHQARSRSRLAGDSLRWLGMLALAMAVLWASGTAHAANPPSERRIALVIGNAKYPAIPLSNPVNDAKLIASNLKKLGFEVAEYHDLGVRDFRRVLRDYARRVQEESGASVFYYAGHGVQIDGRNFLLPVDINLRDEEEVKDESVDVEELFLSRIDRSRGSARIVILDACRDNPFAGKTRAVKTAGGLAEMAARGALIAFSSAPGAAAEDGPSGVNSVYTQHLAEEMMKEGLEVEQMFKNVRVKVLRDTKDRQIPWVNTSLTVNFSFNPGKGQPIDPNALTQEKMERLESELAALRRQLADTRLGVATAAAAAATTAASSPVARPSAATVAAPPATPTAPVTPAAPPATATAAAPATPPAPSKMESELERQIRELEAARAAARVARANSESLATAKPETTFRSAPIAPPLPAAAPTAPPARGDRFGPVGKPAADKQRCSELLHRASIGDPLSAEDESYLVTVCR